LLPLVAPRAALRILHLAQRFAADAAAKFAQIGRVNVDQRETTSFDVWASVEEKLPHGHRDRMEGVEPRKSLYPPVPLDTGGRGGRVARPIADCHRFSHKDDARPERARHRLA
jgi:hypothetical protein